MIHVMLDLETWGNGNDAVPISLGAVKFNDTEILDKFHVGIDPGSAMALGLKVDAGAILWWMHPDRAPALADWLALEKVDLASALYGFGEWFGTESLPVWGNGSTFDNVILRSAYRVCGLEYPAKFWHDWCYRTVKSLAPPDIRLIREGTHHSALDDAICQAKHLQAIRAYLTTASAMLG